MPPTLVLDARISHSGIGRYVQLLLSGLRQQNDFHVRVLTALPTAKSAPAASLTYRRVSAPLYGLREQAWIPCAARKADLLHVPHYNIPVFYTGKIVANINDLTHINFPAYAQTWSSRIYARNMLRIAAHKSAHVITISNYVADQIHSQFNIPRAKISVIYLNTAPDLHPLDPDMARQRVDRWLPAPVPYFLYVGGLRPHKNIPTLLRGFQMFLASHAWPGILLLVGCDPKHRGEVLRDIDHLRLRDKVMLLSDLSDGQLSAFYAAATCFVTASLSEGFCMPLLEAMHCGTPAACAAATCLPEIAGDAALWFDGHDPASLAQCLLRYMRPEVRNHHIRLGFERARWFAAQDCAAQHLALYKDLLSMPA